MYSKIIKRLLDFSLALLIIVMSSPLLFILTIIGAVLMRGNPFFVQERPGFQKRIFKMIKFRTMNSNRDEDGKLLPDQQRLTLYGCFLRNTSLDELPELFNILIGEMSFIGPRPLLVEYLPLYNTEQQRRHSVKPGLTGYAQVMGRNALAWHERFALDVYYVDHISFLFDCKIFIKTILTVLSQENVTVDTMEDFNGHN